MSATVEFAPGRHSASRRRRPASLRLSCLLLLLALQGCAHYALLTSGDVAPEVKRAIAEQDFDRAWRYLERIEADQPEDAELAALRRTLELATRQFENHVIDMATRLADAGRWQDAHEVLEKGRKRWRDGDRIGDASEALRLREGRLYQRLQAELLLAQAQLFQEKAGVIEGLSRLRREDAAAEGEHWLERRATVSRKLTELGESFAAEQDWHRARDLLKAAAGLGTPEQVHPVLAEAERHLAVEADRARRSNEQQTQGRARELLDAYDRSMSLADLLAAREYILGHNENGALDQYAARLQALCKKRYRQGMHDGDALYAQGRYQEAFQSWKSVLQIYPDDPDLLKKLDRAGKVLDSLKALSGR